METSPVAWRVEIRWKDRRDGESWRRYEDYSIENTARKTQTKFTNPGDIEARVVPLHPHGYIVALQDEIQQLKDKLARYERRTVSWACPQCAASVDVREVVQSHASKPYFGGTHDGT